MTTPTRITTPPTRAPRAAAPSAAGTVDVAPAALPSPRDAVSLGEAPPAAPPPAHREPSAGTDGIGDPYYPQMGNGGYDAQHYDIDLKVNVKANRVVGSSTMDAVATQDLSSFNLDFRGFDIDKITVNGAEATFSRKDGELSVQPQTPIGNGEAFSVAVSYHGKPEPWSSVAAPADVGWKRCGDGICVDCEPDGASSWFPVNDHPRDKATFKISMDVPTGYQVASNGTLLQTESSSDRTRYTWQSRDAMAPYLAMVQIGDYVRKDETSPGGVPIRNYFPPDKADAAAYDFGRQGEMIDYFSTLFGQYPFEAYGGVVVPRSSVGGALECQSMSLFDPFVVTGDRTYENVVAHELAHQWFGDAVSVKNWKDIWLNEGFASYGEWLWQEKNQGAASVDETARDVYNWLSRKDSGAAVTAEAEPEAVRKLRAAHGTPLEKSTSRAIVIGAPPPNDIFDEQVYMKGALVLYALRKDVGDDAFFNGLRAYVSQYSGGNAEIADFRDVMERVSGKPLGDFFNAWLYETKLPPFPGDAARAAA